ncbi:MAG: transposase family protein, partial [Gaiellaceae bacterium]
VIQQLSHVLKHRHAARLLGFLYEIEADEDEDNFDEWLIITFSQVLASRYLFRLPYRQRIKKFKIFLNDTGEMNDREFLRAFRMDKKSFWKIVDMIKGNRVFSGTTAHKRTEPPQHQLLTFLKYVGTMGNDANAESIAGFFGIGLGTTITYIRNASRALYALKDDVVYWPGEDERGEIARRICSKYVFKHCVGMVDGTLLPLEYKPSLDGEDYFTRKGGYAINAMVTCDDYAQVCNILVGWPGSCHDNRVFGRTKLFKDPSSHFGASQYLLADSAFKASATVIPAFKNLRVVQCQGRSYTLIRA